MVNFSFQFSSMKHPNQLAITKLCFYKRSAFLHNEEAYPSRLKSRSITTPSNFCFGLSQIFAWPIFAKMFSNLFPDNRRWHFSWFNFIWLFSNHSIVNKLSCSNLLIKKFKSFSHAKKSSVVSKIANFSGFNQKKSIA